ncbi:MAG: GNAT family N-acetyltransferase [Paracoccaceae bacterium]|nr:GNAT family N-acetyltransferase [Paracoccaceae bacterium]
MTPIPTITTDRLILRAPAQGDVAGFAAFYGSEAARFVGGPLRDFEVWRYTAEVLGHWQLRGFGRWMVERRDTPGAIGLIGLHAPLDWPEPEVGWMLWAGNGQGYALEAALAARRYAYDTLGMTTLISSIDPANAASIRLATAMGAQRETKDFEHPVYGTMQVYRHPDPKAVTL